MAGWRGHRGGFVSIKEGKWMRVGWHMQLWIENGKKTTNVKMQGLKVTVQSFLCLSKLFYEGKMTPDMFLVLLRSHDPNTSSWYLWTEENHDNWSLSTTIQDLFMACWLHTMTWICWETGVEIQLCHRRNKYIKINLLFLNRNNTTNSTSWFSCYHLLTSNSRTQTFWRLCQKA